MTLYERAEALRTFKPSHFLDQAAVGLPPFKTRPRQLTRYAAAPFTADQERVNARSPATTRAPGAAELANTAGAANEDEKIDAASARPTKHAASAKASTPANTNRTPPKAKTLVIN